MQVTDLLSVVGYDTSTIATKYPAEKTSKETEIEYSFLVNTLGLEQIREKWNIGAIDIETEFSLDTMYLDQEEDDDPRFDTSISFKWPYGYGDITNGKYTEAVLKFKFVYDEYESCFRNKLKYVFDGEDVDKLFNKVQELNLPILNKRGTLYKAKTKNGDPFNFCVMEVTTKYSHFHYIEIEFDDPQKLAGFKREEYFWFINENNMKPMDFRMSEFYRRFA